MGSSQNNSATVAVACLALMVFVAHTGKANAAVNFKGIETIYGGLNGGGHFLINGGVKFADEKRAGGSVLAPPVTVNHQTSVGGLKNLTSCRYIKYLSSNKKIFCTPDPVDKDLNGYTNPEFDLGLCPHAKKDKPSEMYLYVEGEGGPVQSPNGGAIEGDCRFISAEKAETNWFCSRNFVSYFTPIVNSVSPRVAVPGQVISVFGQTGITDVWSQEAATDTTAAFSLKPQNMEDFFRSLDDTQYVEQRTAVGLKTDLIRVKLGNYVCETSDERGNFFRSFNQRIRLHLSDRRSWFQCRIPDNIPAGNYPISFETKQHGHSILSAQGYGFLFNNASSGHSITVLEKSEQSSKVTVTNITTIKGKSILRVKGTNLNKTGVKVYFGGRECAPTGTQTSSEVQCMKDSRVSNTPHLGPLGWLRERWVFVKKDTDTALNGYAWSVAFGYANARARPEPVEIVDKIRQKDKYLLPGYKIVRFADILSQSSAKPVYDKSHDLLNTDIRRNSVVECVSGVWTPERSGRYRINSDNNAGTKLNMRIKMGQSRPDENSTWMLTQYWTADDDDAWSAPFNVVGGNSYYVEFLLRMNTGNHRMYGGFGANFIFSYHRNDTAGATGSVSRATPRRARSGQYVLRTSDVVADTVTIDIAGQDTHSFDLTLWSGMDPVEIRSKFDRYSVTNAVRKALQWATCDSQVGNTDFALFPDDFNVIGHPFEADRRWLTSRSTKQFVDGGRRDTSVQYDARTYYENHPYAYNGEVEGASMDYSTAYCGASSQRINLDMLPPGRVIAPVTSSFKATQSGHPYLSFAYKLSSDAKATMILRFVRGGAKNSKYFSCAMLLTGADASDISAHPTCIDLRSEVVDDGAWHYLSFRWRDKISTTFASVSTSLTVHGIGVGAQQHLDDCPTSQNDADMYTPQANSDLGGTLWLDQVAFTKLERSITRTVTSSTKLGGLEEGTSAIPYIGVELKNGVNLGGGKVGKRLTLKVVRADKCIGANGNPSTLATFEATITRPTGQTKPLPTISNATRGATNGRPHHSSKLSLYPGMGDIPQNASSDTITQAFESAVETMAGGVRVDDIPDLYDTCTVRARRVYVAHASDLSSPQVGLDKWTTDFGRGRYSRSVRYPRDIPGTSNELDISVTRSDASKGYLAELVPGTARVLNGGHVALGGSASALNVRAHFAAGESQLRTAHVTDQDQKPVPCEVDPSLLDRQALSSNWLRRISVHRSTAILSGTVDCALAVEEAAATLDADGAMASSTGASTRRRLTSDGEEESEEESAEDGSMEGTYGKLKTETHAQEFPGEDTWAHRSLHFSEEDLDALSTSVPSFPERVRYGDVVNHGRRLKYNFSTASKYELPEGSGNFSDPATWGGSGVPNTTTTDILYVPAGFNLTLDQDAYFRVWIIEGRLEFSTKRDIHMQGEFIVVNGDDAHFTIGSPDQPYPKKAKITLHGHWRSLGLPKFGVKVIAMTSGRLTFYGPAVEPWALLQETAFAGDRTIDLPGNLKYNGWSDGSSLVIAGTGYGWTSMSCRMDRKDNCETEEVTILNSTVNNNITTVTLTAPLKYTHLGEDVPVPNDAQNRVVTRRAEVILLDRQIQVTGTDVEAFGAHTMMLSGQMVLDYVQFGPNVGQAFQLGRYAIHYHTPNEHLFKNNLKKSDDPRMQGAWQGQSRTRGCSVHKSFNRMLTAHACFGLNITRNVGYNIMGHGMFIEDGIEQLNVYRENVVIMIHRSFSLLNTDQTPACFWMTNANNRFIGNRAVGSHTFGFWYDPPETPTGPSSNLALGPLGTSFDSNDWKDENGEHRFCLSSRLRKDKTRQCRLLQFENNVAHSNGRSGIWIDHIDHKELVWVRTHLRGVWVKTTMQRQIMLVKSSVVYNNGGEGVGVVEAVGHIHIVDTIGMGNGCDICFIKSGGDGWAGPGNNWAGPLVLNSALVGDAERQVVPRRHGKINFALGLPHGSYVTFKDTYISNFTRKKQMPIHHCPACGLPIKGGVEVRFNNTKFYNVDYVKGDGEYRGRINWFNHYHSNILWDIDGTLTGTNHPGSWAHANKPVHYPWGDHDYGHFPREYCTPSPLVNGITCNSSVSLREVQFRHIAPMYSNSFQVSTGPNNKAPGSGMYHYDSIGRRYDWHATLVMVKGKDAKPIIHNFTWLTEAYRVDDADSWYAEIRDMRKDEWTVMRWPWMRNPYRFQFNGVDKAAINGYDQGDLSYNRSAPNLTYSRHVHGDWSFFPTIEQRDFNIRPDPAMMEVMVSGKLDHDETYQREQLTMYTSHEGKRFNGENDEYPLCTGSCQGHSKIFLSMKKINCRKGDTKRCLPMGKPSNCFSGDPAPEVATQDRDFNWCDTIDGVWTPPAFGDDILIKAGWTVRLGGAGCLETQIVRHLDVYGSLIISDPGLGKQAALRAQTIHVAAGMGYLEAGSGDSPISEGIVRIELYGNRYSAGRFGYNLETKYLAVLGTLSLVGKSAYSDAYQHDPNKRSLSTWANLQAHANKGSKTIVVEGYAHEVWNVGDKLMVGGGVDPDVLHNDPVWKEAELCTISSIVLNGNNHTDIECEETFTYKHAGPELKGGHMFQGLPVSLMTAVQQNVAVVGMEDDTKALAEQQYGAIVAILAVKTIKGMTKGNVHQKAEHMGLDKARTAAKAENFVPPEVCNKRQGTAIINNVHFSQCGQRHMQWGCLNFVAGRGGLYNVADDTEQKFARASVLHNTFSNGYNYAVRIRGSGIQVVGNTATDMYGGFLAIGQANEITHNAAIRHQNDVTSWFHDDGAWGFVLKGTRTTRFYHRKESKIKSTFTHNVASNIEYTGMKISGRACDANPPADDPLQVAENRAYGSPHGFSLKIGEKTMMNRQPVEQYPRRISCTMFENLEVRGTTTYGLVMFGGSTTVHISKVAVWDAGSGLMVWAQNGMSGGSARIISPIGQHVEVRNSLFISSPTRCRNNGISFPAFYPGIEPYRADQGVKTPSRHGGTEIKNVKFVDFTAINPEVNCGGGHQRENYALVNSAVHARYAYAYEDVANPVKVSGLVFENTPADNRMYMIAPSRGRIQRQTPFKWAFAQFYGDGRRNTFVIDLDGSLTGSGVPGTVIPENEIGWFEELLYVDPLGRETMEALIPYTAQWKTDGERIGLPYTPSRPDHQSSADSGLKGPGKLYDEEGLLRGDNCVKVPKWRAYKCDGAKHRQIIFESLDRNHMTRRLSPTSLMTQLPGGKKYMSLYTGPPIYKTSWSGKIARWNTLWMTGHIGATHTVHHTSTNPGVTRVQMRDAGPNDAVHIKYYYGTANRVDVYVRGRKVEPLVQIAFDNPTGPDMSALLPTLNHGDNFYDRLQGYVEFVLRGPAEVQIRVSNMVVLSTEITITDDEFFVTGISGLVTNVAKLLGIPESRIQVAGIGDFAKAKAKIGKGRRRLGEKVPVDIIILEADRRELTVDDDGNVEVGIEEAQLSAASSDLAALAEKLSTASEADLINNTNITLGTLQLQVDETAKQLVVGWTCDFSKFNDSSVCDCNCGRWDPDCDSVENVTTYIRGCGKVSDVDVNISNALSVQEFCVEHSDETKCDLPDPDDVCSEFPCVVGPSIALQDFVKNVTGKGLYCKQNVMETNDVGDSAYVSNGVCTMALLQNGVANTWKTVYETACKSTNCMNGGTPTGSMENCGCSCLPGYAGPSCENATACTSGANGDVCGFGGSAKGTTGNCYCDCPPGRSGANCETATPCTTGPNGNACKNGGNATGSGGPAHCACTCHGTFGGPLCETENSCTVGANGEACANGGTPNGTSGSCSCICAPGYSGPNCETIDACTVGPNGADCQNGGQPDGVTGSCSCKCVEGYGGDNCQTPLPCSSGKDGKTCENGGTSSGYGSISSCSCVCKSDFVGDYCENEKGLDGDSTNSKFDEDEGTNTIVNVTKPDRSDVGVKTNNKKDAGGTVIIVCVVLLALILLCQGLYRYGKKHHWIKEGDKVYEMANYVSHMPDKIVLRKAKLEVHDHNVQTVRTVMGPGILLASRADGVHIVQLSSWKLADGHSPILFQPHHH